MSASLTAWSRKLTFEVDVAVISAVRNRVERVLSIDIGALGLSKHKDKKASTLSLASQSY
jgi:hypothetical protein